MQQDYKHILLDLLTDRIAPEANLDAAHGIATALVGETGKRYRDSAFIAKTTALFINSHLCDEEKKIIAPSFPLHMVEQGITQYCLVDHNMLGMDDGTRPFFVERVANGVKDIIRNKKTAAKDYRGNVLSIAADDTGFCQEMVVKLPFYDDNNQPLRSKPHVVGFVWN